ncbi:TonB-dependent receptor, partial [Halioglobus sp.]|nr:TonB-dependent receptor [Halioglobus sp.]
GNEFPLQFVSGEGEDVEIEVSFSAVTGDVPRVQIRKFGVGDAGQGFVTGQILDSQGSPLPGATVAVVGTSLTSITNVSGVYELAVPRGEYSISVSAPGFQGATLSNVRVMADLGVTASVTMLDESATAPASTPALEEVFVVGVFNPQDSAASVERYATSITNAIDIEQLERFGDSDVGAALNRVVGVQVVDRKYATVRGLDGRYISSTLNGLLMPSTDTQRREVELDLFPTVIVEGIEIQKSYTPERLASTTGGAIMIQTKGIPDERLIKVSGDLGYNPGTTFDDILSYKSSERDQFGYQNGLRNLSNTVLNATEQGRSLTVCDPSIDPVRCTSPADAAALGVQFQDDYRVGDKTALPNAEVSIAYGDRLTHDGNEWGYYLALDFDRKTVDRGNARLSNPIDISGKYERSTENTAWTAYAAAGYEYGAANEILSKTIFLRNTDDITRVESGFDNTEDNQVDVYLLDWIEREFFSQAFTGYNEFDLPYGEHAVEWQLAYSRTERDEPDRRSYTYFNNNLSTTALERRWSDLHEDSFDLGGEYSLSIDWGDVSATELKVGGMWSDKDRDFDQYRFGFDTTAFGSDLDLGIDQSLENDILSYNNYAIGKVVLTTKTTDTDSYTSDETVTAFFANTITDIGEAWTAEVGARFEKFEQDIKYPNQFSANNDLDYDDWYPALNVTWRATEQFQFRWGYSETVSYPGIIERAEAQTFDPDTDQPIFGNPNLVVSTIENFDIRAEYYFSDTESVSLAVFYKDITDPVERAIPDASGSAARGITFINQESADLTGIELDGTKNVWEDDVFLAFVSGNLAWIDSEVDLSSDSRRLEGNGADGRQLQGQSEWLANMQIGVDHFPSEQKFTLLMNYFDERIFRVARGANTGPEYEDGRVIVDFSYEKKWNENLTIEGAIKNILDTEVKYSQNGNTIEKYSIGRFFKIGVTYSF